MINAHTLNVYLHGKKIGILTRQAHGKLSFQYEKNAKRLSVSMPVRTEPYEENIARPYFAALLPDDIVRRHLANFLGVSPKNDFGMLEIIGGECAGAVSLYSVDTKVVPEKKIDRKLTEKKLIEIITLLSEQPLLTGKHIRLSLAGAQNKIAIHMKGKNFFLPSEDQISTHIVKPARNDIKDVAHNELFCLQLAKSLNIPTPSCELRWANHIPYLLIERYDRKRLRNGRLQRIHQEDFCQAMSIPPEMRYENEGGPTLKQCFNLIDKYDNRPAIDKLSLLNVVIFNYLIGNNDAHGKNFSLLHTDAETIRLTLFYDLLSTVVYKNLSKKMAMKIGGKYIAEQIFSRHWEAFANEINLSIQLVQSRINMLAAQILQRASETKQTLIAKKINSPIYDEIIKVIEKRVQHISK